MSAIHIETMLDGDTLYLPQLKPLVGKCVEIIVREKVVPAVTPAKNGWAAVESAVLSLVDYDFDAYLEMRGAELRVTEPGLS